MLIKKELEMLTTIYTNEHTLPEPDEILCTDIMIQMQMLNGSLNLLQGIEIKKIEMVAVNEIEGDKCLECPMCIYYETEECNGDKMCGHTSNLPEGKTYIYKEVDND